MRKKVNNITKKVTAMVLSFVLSMGYMVSTYAEEVDGNELSVAEVTDGTSENVEGEIVEEETTTEVEKYVESEVTEEETTSKYVDSTEEEPTTKYIDDTEEEEEPIESREITFHFQNASEWENVGAYIFEGIAWTRNACPLDKCFVVSENDDGSDKPIWPGAKMECEFGNWYKVTAEFYDVETNGLIVVFNNGVGDIVANDMGFTQADADAVIASGIPNSSNTTKEETGSVMLNKKAIANMGVELTDVYVVYDGSSTKVYTNANVPYEYSGGEFEEEPTEVNYEYRLAGNMTGWDTSSDASLLIDVEGKEGIISFDTTLAGLTTADGTESESWQRFFSILGHIEETKGTWARTLLGEVKYQPNSTYTCLTYIFVDDLENDTDVTVYYDTRTATLVILDAEENEIPYTLLWVSSDREDGKEDEGYDYKLGYTLEELSQMTYDEYVQTLSVGRQNDIEKIADTYALSKSLFSDGKFSYIDNYNGLIKYLQGGEDYYTPNEEEPTPGSESTVVESEDNIILEYTKDIIEGEVVLDTTPIVNDPENTDTDILELFQKIVEQIIEQVIAETEVLEEDVEFQAYDINLMVDEEKVQPNGYVDVTVPCPAEYDPEKCHVYRMNDDGTFTKMNAEYTDDGKFKMRTNHFSVYIVTETEVEAKRDGIGNANLDAEIDTQDAVLMKKYLAGYDNLGIYESACDIDGDGEITSADTVLLLKYLAGYDVELE